MVLITKSLVHSPSKVDRNSPVQDTDSDMSKNGFTFIELLITIVIMSILFTVGFSNFRGFASRQKIEAVTREIKADLRLAQQEAVAGKKPIDEVTGTTIAVCDSASNYVLQGYRFTYIDSTSYSIDVICSGGTAVIKTISLAERYPDIALSFSSFIFNALADGVSSNQTISIQELDGGGAVVTTRQIAITTSGQIN